ncbi:MAG: LacI family DNA-binding transcriptional regulator [Brooklawnia sp.]|jgi:LacI family transcriptional regulator
MSARGIRVGTKDVAKLAGVSVGTVSHVLNRPERVSEKRRRAVEEAIETLGYVPNHAARQLKVGTSTLLGFLLPHPNNPFYSNLAHGVIAEAENRDLHVMTANSFGVAERASRYLSVFAQHRARGVIVVPNTDDLTAEVMTSAQGTPVVLAAAHDPEHRLCAVWTDDVAGGRLAAEHLIAVGKRHIAVVATGFRNAQERWRGALDAAQQHPGVVVELVTITRSSIPVGHLIAEELMARPASERPDGIFTTSDLVSIGVLHALATQGRLRVPEDIAVIGYDDLEFARSTIVPLSTVQQHERRIGELTVGLIEDEHKPGHEHQEIVLDPVLVTRTSTTGRP